MFAPERLKYIRMKRGFTQAELAKKVGIGINSVARYENGQRMPDIEVIYKIANVFGVMSTLFDNSIHSDGEFYQRDIDEMSKEDKILDDCLKSCVVYTEEGKGEIISMQNSAEDLLCSFNCLNERGKEEAINYVAYLTTKDEYTAPDSSTASEHEEGEP